MILKKIILNGKAVYEPITQKEALAYWGKADLEFTSDDEKEEFEEKIEELEELTERIEELAEEAEEIREELDDLNENDKYLFETKLEEIKKELEGCRDLSADVLENKLETIEDELSEIEDQIDELLDEEDDEKDDDEPVKIKVNGKKIHLDFSDTFGKVFGNLFGKKNGSKSADLVAALPFMDKEDLRELVDEIISGYEQYKDINLVEIMPFLDTSDCDALFKKFVIEENKYNIPLVAVAPFVSTKCLSNLVDEYIKGNCQHVEMSTLYPFLDGKDVKKVFNYMLSKKKNHQA